MVGAKRGNEWMISRRDSLPGFLETKDQRLSIKKRPKECSLRNRKVNNIQLIVVNSKSHPTCTQCHGVYYRDKVKTSLRGLSLVDNIFSTSSPSNKVSCRERGRERKRERERERVHRS